MDLCGKKLGLLIAAKPGTPPFACGLGLAKQARKRGVTVYLYCIDDAVTGLDDPTLRNLQKEQGVHLYACAYEAQRRDLELGDNAIFAGLSIVSDLISATDRFVAFT